MGNGAVKGSTKTTEIHVHPLTSLRAEDEEEEPILENEEKTTLEEKDEKHHLSFATQKKLQWFDLQYHDANRTKIKKPAEFQSNMPQTPQPVNKNLLNRVLGSLVGLAVGDSLGAHVEFRPRQYLLEHPVTDLDEGGTWGLKKGQFTDDTSMALCLASSLIARQSFSPYDQLVRYKWWYRYGYMSSTGSCFDIGNATKQSLCVFEERQKDFSKKHKIPLEDLDYLDKPLRSTEFNIYCSNDGAAGNGGLMRLSPVPLFFHRNPPKAVEYSGVSAQVTHGDVRAYDACRFYGALIVAAINGESKKELLDENFYQDHEDWFNGKPLHKDIQKIVQGSYKKKKRGYDDGIRGKGYVVDSLEAALWAFYVDGNSFERGALAAVNLGDDADTTAAIYGQLAGAYYGYDNLPRKWTEQIYAGKLLARFAEWIVYEGQQCSPKSLSNAKTSQPTPKTTQPTPKTTQPTPKTTQPTPKTTQPNPKTSQPTPKTSQRPPASSNANPSSSSKSNVPHGRGRQPQHQSSHQPPQPAPIPRSPRKP